MKCSRRRNCQIKVFNNVTDIVRDDMATTIKRDSTVSMDRFSSYEQKFHDMTDGEFSIHRTRWNIMSIDDAKGLEFSSVIVLSGRMSRNERYIAFTHALDDLYIYPDLLDVTGFEKKPRKKKDGEQESGNSEAQNQKTEDSNRVAETVVNVKDKPKHGAEKVEKNHSKSAVREFFESNGLEVVDNRDQGGRLWVI